MRILITNDDGIGAAGLVPLVKWAQKHGEVVVAAPRVEQSGMSHGIEIHKAFQVKKTELLPGVTAYAVDSTPADCVRLTVLGLKEKFDLVISGINRGFNIGRDIMYSGTVAAVFEAANLGIPAIAVSTCPEFYSHAQEYMDQVYDFVVKNRLLQRHIAYNINIPADSKGILITRQGGNYYSDDFFPQENDMYMPMGKDVFQSAGNNVLDTDAVLRGGYISVMPLTLDRTDLTMYESLLHLNP